MVIRSFAQVGEASGEASGLASSSVLLTGWQVRRFFGGGGARF